MPVQILCTICMDVYPLSEMLFRQCGHGLCLQCTHGLQQTECPTCRKPLEGHPPHPIYAEFASDDTSCAKEARMEGVLQDIRNNPDSPLGTLRVKAIGKRLRDAEHQSGVGVDTEELKPLLDAVKTLESDIIPLREKLAEYKKVNRRNSKLRQTNEELSTELANLRTQLSENATENADLKRRLKEAKLRRTADKEEVDRLREKCDARKKRCQDLERELQREREERAQEMAGLQRAVSLGERKLKVITKEKKQLKRKLDELAPHDPEEDSLVVEL